MNAARRWLEGDGFPVFALALLATIEVLFLLGLLAPTEGTALEAFAQDFRVWCYGLDPATGGYEWSKLMAMLVPPWMMAAFVALLWAEPLRAAARQPVRAAVQVLFAAGLAFGAAGWLIASAPPGERGELPFPAEVLRTDHKAPVLALTDHFGADRDLADERGNVVVLTAVYAHCPHTCPLILDQSRNAIAALTPEEREDVRIFGVTMDPERDDVATLATLAEGHSLDTDVFSLLTGDSGEVNRILDDMGVRRTRDPQTGVIDHANLFLVLDREGKVAYRLSLGERQERWLISALRTLVAEAPRQG